MATFEEQVLEEAKRVSSFFNYGGNGELQDSDPLDTSDTMRMRRASNNKSSLYNPGANVLSLIKDPKGNLLYHSDGSDGIFFNNASGNSLDMLHPLVLMELFSELIGKNAGKPNYLAVRYRKPGASMSKPELVKVGRIESIDPAKDNVRIIESIIRSYNSGETTEVMMRGPNMMALEIYNLRTIEVLVENPEKTSIIARSLRESNNRTNSLRDFSLTLDMENVPLQPVAYKREGWNRQTERYGWLKSITPGHVKFVESWKFPVGSDYGKPYDTRSVSNMPSLQIIALKPAYTREYIVRRFLEIAVAKRYQ